MNGEFYNIYTYPEARTEIPACSFCIINHACITVWAMVASTSIRYFLNQSSKLRKTCSSTPNWPRWSPILADWRRPRNTRTSSAYSTP